MSTQATQATENSIAKRGDFRCETCDYTCCNNQKLKQHLGTNKHKKLFSNMNGNKGNGIIQCEVCTKTYKDRTGLWRHRKTCKPRENIIMEIRDEKSTSDTVVHDNQSLIHILVSENKELRNLLIEQAKEYMSFINQHTTDILNKVVDNAKPVTITNNNNNTNSNNQAFNINVFLNDTCKDAINFTDFINSLTVSREELMNTGNVGFVDGVSKILIDTLKQLGVHERPIHCTDLKRETMYIKDDNKWNKEDTDQKVREAIAMITIQSMKTLHGWKDTNPDYKDSKSDFSKMCIPMQMYSVAGPNRDTYYPKIITAIAKEMMVDKYGKNRLT